MSTTEQRFKLAKYVITLVFILVLIQLVLSHDPKILEISINLKEWTLELVGNFASDTPES